ncbi:ABC transporter permease [Paraburkholderia xenovorans]|jgi:simple sugar transport system permease protein|uniref:ABC transporter permease n=1 Tax=Paraburkholderia xenovorans TaxID=36873 RepID=UPI0015C57F76|nr:ABC transporter permease [Paraburkholderia xenovorans]NPT33359.1 ABC transporter permease [Paraburkholderia xenovorans]
MNSRIDSRLNQTMTTPTIVEVAPEVKPPGLRARLARNPEWFTVALIAVTCLIVGAINPRFFQLATLFDLLHSATTMSLFALGTLVVLASGGIDVSFTAIAALTMYGITKAVFAWWPDAPFALILLTGALGGVVLGVINGLLVHRLKAPSLIVTIGTQYLYRGLLLTFIGTTFFMNIPRSMDHFGRIPLFFYHTADGLRAVLPVSVVALVAAAVLTWWLLNRTMMGRGVYAMGGSLAIAERLGYNLRAIHLFVFGYTGMLAGIAGILHVSNNRLANPFDLVGSELDVIAAVILGGARITGGTGTVAGTLLGVVLVTLINSVLILVGVPSTWQKVIIGAFILIAGTLFALQRKS